MPLVAPEQISETGREALAEIERTSKQAHRDELAWRKAERRHKADTLAEEERFAQRDDKTGLPTDRT